MGHRSATPFLDGQSGLSAIQRLNLAFFIDAEHDCLLRRVQTCALPICHLLQKLRIARQLESLRAMWLQLVGAPDIADGGLTDLIPWFCAMVRQLQCVIPVGLVCVVAFTMAAILSISYQGFRPRPGAISHRPSNPSAPKRFRHRITVLRFTESCSAIATSDFTAAADTTIRQRNATCCGVPCAAIH